MKKPPKRPKAPPKIYYVVHSDYSGEAVPYTFVSKREAAEFCEVGESVSTYARVDRPAPKKRARGKRK